MAALIFSSLSKTISCILSSLPSSSSLPSAASPSLADEITKLDRTVRRIRAVLADADEREIVDESMKLWLFELKQAAYDAEEVLEDNSYELLRSAVLEEAKVAAADEITKLDRTVHQIRAVLVDADEKEIVGELTKLWLVKLKQSVYDAEEVLEDRSYELLRSAKGAASNFDSLSKMTSLSSSSPRSLPVSLSLLSQIAADVIPELDRTVRGIRALEDAKVSESSMLPLYDASFQENTLHRINKVREKLDEISRDRVNLALTEQDGSRRREISTTRSTSSLLDPLEVYGREDEKNQIMHALFEDVSCVSSKKRSREHQDEMLRLISIVAMGGMGKTTLARLVYNDAKVQNHFEVRAWVWVSEAFDKVKLTKAVIESITSEPCNFTELEPLQRRLQKEIQGKKVLLILDDIWNEDPVRWETMRRPFFAVAKGSRMIITTRNENVVSVMRTKLVIRLGGLPKRDSWALFCRLAFPEEAREETDLGLIGQKIVEKSKGVPLVVRTLGALLSSDTSLEFWNDVLRSNLWELDRGREYILPILKLSYYCLPSALKQCFTFLAAFPKGHELDREELVRMWCALGFIHDDGAKQKEEIGRSYVNELVRRSFLQNLQLVDSEKIVTMHDLIHDLAKSIGGEEIIVTENRRSSNLGCSSQLRYLAVLLGTFHFDSKETVGPFSLPVAGCYALRSLSFLSCSITEQFNLEARMLQSPQLQYLRILDASSSHQIKLEESVGALHHLRYLGMCQSEMPEAICKLYKLQTLVNTYAFGTIYLPRNMMTLTSLRHLILPRDPVDKIPAGIGRLTNLQSLSTFVVSSAGSGNATLAEMKDMNSIRGELCILGLENIAHDSIEAAREASLSKKQLTRLKLVWNYLSMSPECTPHDEAVLEHLRPHSCIQHLRIHGYRGIHFPAWLGDESFSKIVELKVRDSHYCKHLPPLGQLPSLKQLKLTRLRKLRSIGPEFYGNVEVSFPSLERLEFQTLVALEEWWPGSRVRSVFPRLRTLEIRASEKLTCLPILNMHALTEITVSFCRKLTRIVGLEECIMGRASNSRSDDQQVLCSLQSVEISFCPSLEESLVSLLHHQQEISFSYFDEMQLLAITRKSRAH